MKSKLCIECGTRDTYELKKQLENIKEMDIILKCL